jgi:hypothetical protein
VQVPPALAAVSTPQKDFDFDYERRVMQDEASTSIDTFIKKAEVSQASVYVLADGRACEVAARASVNM